MSTYRLNWHEEIRSLLPDPLPAGWQVAVVDADGFPAFTNYRQGLSIIACIEPQVCPVTGKPERWLHWSVATRGSRPVDWHTFVRLKEEWLGAETLAIQVLPPRSEYVNLHKTCLHLYVNLDRRAVPDFTGRLATGERSI